CAWAKAMPANESNTINLSRNFKMVSLETSTSLVILMPQAEKSYPANTGTVRSFAAQDDIVGIVRDDIVGVA
ncbi:MAG: hypothetical protein Q7R45_11230, partial [Sulfuricaulis sp.]|nr:hypothetical protein [Sulfuricaulis sp.]